MCTCQHKRNRRRSQSFMTCTLNYLIACGHDEVKQEMAADDSEDRQILQLKNHI